MLQKIKTYIPLNWDLVSNPVNWIVVMLMVAVAGFALALLFNASDGAFEGNE